MENIDYVRKHLATAKEELGRIAQIARDTKTDSRTLRAVLLGQKSAHAATVDKLAKYFKRLNKDKDSQ